MSDAFEKWFKTEMLPAECDDERVIVGMRLCWNAAMLYAADIAQANFAGDPRGYYISGRTDAANAIKKEVPDV